MATLVDQNVQVPDRHENVLFSLMSHVRAEAASNETMPALTVCGVEFSLDISVSNQQPSAEPSEEEQIGMGGTNLARRAISADLQTFNGLYCLF